MQELIRMPKARPASTQTVTTHTHTLLLISLGQRCYKNRKGRVQQLVSRSYSEMQLDSPA
jgi:hypothetical protein